MAAQGQPESLIQTRRPSAKVCNSALEDGCQTYHRSFFCTADGQCCVGKQGTRDADSTARRYYWLGEGPESFVNEPHAAVCCDRRNATLKLVASESRGARTAVPALMVRPDKCPLQFIEQLRALVLPWRVSVLSVLRIA